MNTTIKAVECIVTVEMDYPNGAIAFLKGEVYPVTVDQNGYINAIDEQGEDHGIGHTRELSNLSEFIYIHFIWKGKR